MLSLKYHGILARPNSHGNAARLIPTEISALVEFRRLNCLVVELPIGSPVPCVFVT
jgi:hypothetical protein